MDYVIQHILYFCWRYDPNAYLPTDIDTEQDRIIFIKSIAQFMVSLKVLEDVIQKNSVAYRICKDMWNFGRLHIGMKVLYGTTVFSVLHIWEPSI